MHLIPHPTRRDWFWFPRELAHAASGLGTLDLDNYGRSVVVHRTYLPVIARRLLDFDPFDPIADQVRQLRLQVEHAMLPPPPDIARRAAFDAEVVHTGKTLRGYQHVAREFARDRGGVLLGDQMRLGKSPTTISLHDPARGPLFIIAPLATREVWLEWMRWRWPEKNAVVLKGIKYDPDVVRSADLVFAHYDVIVPWMSAPHALGRRIGTLVFDEAHILSNHRSKRARAALLLATHANRRVCLTGTPMWNKPAGLYVLLSLLAPGAWGSAFDFMQRYCDPRMGSHGYAYDGASEVEEFRSRIAQLMIRRTWQDVAAELPAIERTIEIAPVSADEALKIDVALEKARVGAATVAGDLARLHRILGSFKIATTIDCVDRIVAGGEAVVVWVWHVSVGVALAERCCALGHANWFISGDMTQDDRARVMCAWRENPVGVLIVSIAVGQAGIDLSHARHAVFCEFTWTPAVIAQAEMRTFHLGRPMTVTYVAADHDVDRRIVEVLRAKCELGGRVGMPAAETAIVAVAGAIAGVGADVGDVRRLAAAILAAGDEDDAED